MTLRTTVSTLVAFLAVALSGSLALAEPSPDSASQETTDGADAEGDLPEEDAPNDGDESDSEADDPDSETDEPDDSASNEEQTASDSDDSTDGTGGRRSGEGGDSPESSRSVDQPSERLEAAESAFQNGDFEEIPELLEPILEPEPRLSKVAARIRARELLGVGLYFQAQQSTDSDERDALLERARKQFLELLRERPDYELDSLLFPASVVEIFDSVREEHSEELQKIRETRKKRRTSLSGASSDTLYIERSVTRNIYAWNFFPGGIGQFQNGETVKGTLFAAGQVAAVGTNVFSFLQIQSLRNSDGTFQYEEGGNSAFHRASRWRLTQYASIGVLVGVYVWSVVDGLSNYQPTEVEIRTRDEPPPELSDNSPSSGKPPMLRIGLGHAQIRW